MPSFYDGGDDIYPDDIKNNITAAFDEAIRDDETPNQKKPTDAKDLAAQERSFGEAITDDFGSVIKQTDDRYLELKEVKALNLGNGGISIKTLEDQLNQIVTSRESLINQSDNTVTTSNKTKTTTKGKVVTRVDSLTPQLVEGINYLDREAVEIQDALKAIYRFENEDRIKRQGSENIVPIVDDRIMKPEDIKLADIQIKSKPSDAFSVIESVTPTVNESLIANFDADLTADKYNKITIKNKKTKYAKTVKTEKGQTTKELKRELQYGLDTAGTLDSGKKAVVTSEVMENKPLEVIQTTVNKMKPTRAKYAISEIIEDPKGVSEADDFSFGSLKNKASEIEEDAAAIKRQNNINPPVDIGQNLKFSKFTKLMRDETGNIVPFEQGKIDTTGKFIKNKALEFSDVMPHEIEKFGITRQKGLKSTKENPNLLAESKKLKMDLSEYQGPLNPDDLIARMDDAVKDNKFVEFKERTGVIKLNKEKKKILVEKTRNIVGSKYKIGYQDLLASGHELKAKSKGGKYGDSTAMPYVSEGRFKNYLVNRNITMSQTGGQSMNKTLKILSDKNANNLFNTPYISSKNSTKSLGYYGITKGDVYKVLESEAVEIENIRKSVVASITPDDIKNPAYEDVDLDISKRYDKLAGTTKGKKTGKYNIERQENVSFDNKPTRGKLEQDFRKKNNITGALQDYGIEHPKVLKQIAPEDKKYLFDTEKIRRNTGQGIEKSLGIPDTGGFQHLFKQSDFTNKVKQFEKTLIYDAYASSLKADSPRLPITTDTNVLLKNISPENFIKSMNFASKGMSGIEISKDNPFTGLNSKKSLVRKIAASQFSKSSEGAKFGDVERGLKFVDELKRTFKLLGKKG